MHRNRIFRIVALVGLMALAGFKLDPVSKGTSNIGETEIGCDPRGHSHCAPRSQFGYPVGDGLLVMLPEDFF